MTSNNKTNRFFRKKFDFVCKIIVDIHGPPYSVSFVSQVSSAKLHHVFTLQQLSVVLAAIIMP